MKRLIWYGHVQRMPEARWPKRMLDWMPNRRRKRGRPRRAWRENIQEEMAWRDLRHGDWEIEKHGRQDAENGDIYIYIIIIIIISLCFICLCACFIKGTCAVKPEC
jgi:hypothetical protein